MSESIVLCQAWVWTCPACGIEHVEHGVPSELTPEERESIRRVADDGTIADGEFITIPDAVECQCGASYDVDTWEAGLEWEPDA